MITLKSCPNCDSRNFVEYKKVVTVNKIESEMFPGIRIEVVPISSFFLCQNCHLIFQNPRMSNTELDRFYAKGYYRKMVNVAPEEKDKDEMDRAKIDSEIIKQKVGKINSHLDIGASRGYLLELVDAKLKVAVESDIEGFTAKGVKVYPKISKVTQKSFDLVTAIHVLEHVSKPVKHLHQMSKLVSKDGYLIIEVPSWKSPGGTPLRLPHLYHFEPDVLRLMCKEVGLKVVGTEFTPHLLLICQQN